MSDKVPVVDINCFGKDLPIKTYSENALKWAKGNLILKGSFFCPCLNADIQVSTKGIKHTISQKQWDQQGNFNHETISVIKVLESLIQHAEVRYSGPDRYGSENVKCIKMLKAPVNISGTIKNVELLIKEVYINKSEGITLFVFYNHVFI